MRLALLVALLALCGIACEAAPPDARRAQIVAVLAAADEPLIRARPALVAGKYARMASGAFPFYRGALPVYRSDVRSGTTLAAVTRFGLDVPLVPSLGDPHPENFGALLAADGTFGIEPNDFDAADRAPYLWDVRRLTAGMALAATQANVDDEAARAQTFAERRAAARAAAVAYAAAVERAARGEALGRVTDARGSVILEDVLSRSRRDAARRRELAERTVLEGGTRRLLRGSVDPEDPERLALDLPAFALGALPDAIERYRRSLAAPPPPEHLQLLDAVRELGSGIASWPRVRVLLLVRGPSDDPGDDVLLELKEVIDSTIAGLYPPGVYADDVLHRVRVAQGYAWARPDAEPLWGTTTWLGFPCQIRLESEGQKSVRVERMVGERGTPEALAALGAVLGEILARVHTSGPEGLGLARALFARFGADPGGFADEQADAAVAYADLTREDHARFSAALVELGPRLGVPFDPSDAPRPDLAALFAVPPRPETAAP